VRVEPEGFPQEEVFNVVVNRDAAGAETIKIASPLPSSGVVEGSVRSLLSVVGDLMGPSIKGLERLVRVPTGCGEQNMIGMAPNVYVLTYLDKARQLTDELREKATSNILRGYQRELQYRHSNGAFSAFGEGSGAGGLAGRGRIASPLPSANSGSLWLTAFVVRVFAQSAEAAAGMYVDPDVLSTAAAFIASNQAPDGSFTDPSPPLHSEMSGGAGEGPGLAAYCLLAMVEAGRSAGNVDASVSYLAAAAGSGFGGSSYVAAIAAHALTAACAKANKGCNAAKQARQKMLDMGVADEEGTMRWGAAPATQAAAAAGGGGRVGVGGGHGSSTEVEGTAYAVLALVRGGDVSSAYAGARYLLLQRNARGGFRSTQDTVVALEALRAYAAATYSREVALCVAPQLPAAAGAKAPGVLTVDNANFDLLQQVDVSPATELTATVSGTGTALVQLGVTYNLVEDPTQPEYDITVTVRATKTAPGAVAGGRNRLLRRRGRSLSAAAATVSADDARSIDVEACVRRRLDGTALGMSLLEIGLFTRFAPDAASLEELRVKGAGVINRVDVDDRKVVVYMEEIGAGHTTCVTFQAAQEHEVKNLKPAPSTVVSYYHPEAKGSAVAAAEVELLAGGGGGGVTVDGKAHVPGAGVSATPPPPALVSGETRRGGRPFWISFLLTVVFAFTANGF
jgi:CD109 antigen